MKSLPSSEIHAFWVTPVDAFDDLAPAELLAGRSFETRSAMSAAQRGHLAQSAGERQSSVSALLNALPSRGLDLIS